VVAAGTLITPGFLCWGDAAKTQEKIRRLRKRSTCLEIHYKYKKYFQPSVMSYAPLDEESNLRSVPSASEDDETAASVSSLRPSLSMTRGNKEQRRSALSEPLTANGAHPDSEDPYYVFREDLYRKLDLVDESLAEYLRIVHQTVSDHDGGGL
jgi:hypothetical protein